MKFTTQVLERISSIDLNRFPEMFRAQLNTTDQLVHQRRLDDEMPLIPVGSLYRFNVWANDIVNIEIAREHRQTVSNIIRETEFHHAAGRFDKNVIGVARSNPQRLVLFSAVSRSQNEGLVRNLSNVLRPTQVVVPTPDLRAIIDADYTLRVASLRYHSNLGQFRPRVPDLSRDDLREMYDIPNMTREDIVLDQVEIITQLEDEERIISVGSGGGIKLGKVAGRITFNHPTTFEHLRFIVDRVL
jgi:hypothetical protein